MTAELRRYPRFDLHTPGTIELETAATERVDVEVVCVACEGVGVTVATSSRAVLPGSAVVLRFALPDGAEVELLARVVWAAAGKAGLRLRVAESAPASRQSFGAFIAPRTKAAIAASRRAPTAA